LFSGERIKTQKISKPKYEVLLRENTLKDLEEKRWNRVRQLFSEILLLYMEQRTDFRRECFSARRDITEQITVNHR